MKNFCYLGNRLNASGGSEAAVTPRTRVDGRKFIECEELLYACMLSLKMKEWMYLCEISEVLKK